MLGRVAESIYWMGRYAERADNVARFLGVNHHLALDLPTRSPAQWEPLIVASGDEESFRERYDDATRQNVIQFLTFDEKNPNSILSCLYAARENARSVREIISTDMWQQINTTYMMARDAKTSGQGLAAPHQFFEQVRLYCTQFVGATDSTMTHGEGWRFARMGRLLERADKTTRILDVKYYILLPKVKDVGTPYDGLQWSSLLRSASAFEMYRQHFGRIEPKRVVEFLLLDRQFPRAIVYCLTKANEALHAICRTPLGSFDNDAERKLGALRSEMAYTTVDEIINFGLHEYIDRFQTKLNAVGKAIHEQFFALRSIDQANAQFVGRAIYQ